MSDLRDVYSAALRQLIGNMCLGKALLAEGTNANTFKTTNAINFAIDGVVYAKSATDNIAFATGGDAFVQQAAGETRYYLFQIDSAGTITVIQGENGGEIPQPAASRCAIGAMKIVTNNAATFTPGSTDLGATDVVDTFYDFSCMPLNLKP